MDADRINERIELLNAEWRGCVDYLTDWRQSANAETRPIAVAALQAEMIVLQGKVRGLEQLRDGLGDGGEPEE